MADIGNDWCGLGGCGEPGKDFPLAESGVFVPGFSVEGDGDTLAVALGPLAGCRVEPGDDVYFFSSTVSGSTVLRSSRAGRVFDFAIVSELDGDLRFRGAWGPCLGGDWQQLVRKLGLRVVFGSCLILRGCLVGAMGGLLLRSMGFGSVALVICARRADGWTFRRVVRSVLVWVGQWLQVEVRTVEPVSGDGSDRPNTVGEKRGYGCRMGFRRVLLFLAGFPVRRGLAAGAL